MKTRILLILLSLSLIFSLCSCFDSKPNDGLQSAETSSKSEEDLTRKSRLTRESREALIREKSRFRDNETPYKYLSTSELEFEDISYCTSLSQISIEYENKFFRETEDKCYAICSLKDNKLCYVFLRFSGDTGIRYYIEKFVQYPSDDIDSDFYDSILEIDYPENILG